jgi:hypothetical protein
MKNRYGDEYHWEKISDNEYKFVMEGDSMKYHRYGGKDGQEGIDLNDLGMFDPSGGPYVAIGSLVEGRVVEHIRSAEETFIVKVK